MKKINAYQQKLKSESGASLAAALLFFVVCAAVGSIIIAAAMSSAGRMSGITSADNQRYALESARNFLEDALLPDPEKTKIYYVNENVIVDTENDIADTYQNGKIVKEVKEGKGWKKYETECKTTDGVEEIEQIPPAMAEWVYKAYWKEIKASWPTGDSQNGSTSGNTVLAQSSAAVTGTSISQNDKTDSQTTGGWVPSGSPGLGENEYPRFSSTMTLNDSSWKEVQGTVPVKVEMDMRQDFSVLVTLTTSAGENAGNNGQSSQTMTDQFVLYPTISVDYESVLPQTGSGQAAQTATDAPTTKDNERKIHCEIQWLTVGEEPAS